MRPRDLTLVGKGGSVGDLFTAEKVTKQHALRISLDWFRQQAEIADGMYAKLPMKIDPRSATQVNLVLLPMMTLDRATLREGDQRSICEGMSFAKAWGDIGQPIFELTHGLTHALVLTRCDNLFGRDVRLPYPSFVLKLPTPNPLTFSYQGGDEERQAAYIYVHTWDAVEDAASAKALSENVQTVCKAADHDFAQVLTRVMDDVATSQQVVVRLLASDGYSVSQRLHALADDDPYAVWTEALDSGTCAPDEDPLNTRDRRCAKMALALVANLSVYLNAKPEEWVLPKPKKRKKKPTLQPKKHWVIGRSIKLPRIVQQAARAGEHQRGWTLSRRFMVRGHWRNVACGPGRTERRRQWIAPFWKGPEDSGQALLHTFEVATASERRKERT